MKEAPDFRYSSAGTANRLVAGIPAAARLARAYGIARPHDPLRLAIGERGTLSALTLAEVARIAPGVQVVMVDAAPDRAIAAEMLTGCEEVAAVLSGRVPALAPTDPQATLREAARSIIRATGKPGDGLIARHINRPVSQAVSALLLRLAWIRPGHATAMTALAGLAMLSCLLAIPSPAGLLAGAVLFQVASVIDGIDGELARATYRSSKSGASIDSLVDGVTNCSFLAGAGANFWMQNAEEAALVCWVATAFQIVGLSILGFKAWASDGIVHFNAVKQGTIGSTSSDANRLVKDVGGRDFYCFAFMLAALAGVLIWALIIFLVASGFWLAIIIRSVMQRTDS